MPVDILGLPFRDPLSPRNTIDILRPLIDPSGWSFFLSTAGYLSMCGVWYGWVPFCGFGEGCEGEFSFWDGVGGVLLG